MDEVEEEESVSDRYARLSRHEKLALLMIALGPDASSTLLKDLTKKMQTASVKKSLIFHWLTKNSKTVY